MLRSFFRIAARASRQIKSPGFQGSLYAGARQITGLAHQYGLSRTQTWGGLATILGLTAAGTVFSSEVFASSVQEKSFIMIKPDGVNRRLISEIVKRFESKGYKLVAIKIMVPSRELAERHYEEHAGKPFYPGLVEFLSSGAVLAMVWEGKDVIKYSRTMIGATNPLDSAPGTIRGDYGIDVGRNLIHGSDSVESAQREIALWFSTAELAEYDLAMGKWMYE